MRSSTSSFELEAAWVDAPAPAARPFWPRALAIVAFALGLALVAGHVAGRFYAPQPLAPTAAELRGADHFVTIFGNSRTEAGLDPERLARGMSDATVVTRARAFTGGGWDAIHFYQLALVHRGVLRPGRDAVLIEVSPLSANDALTANRLGVIRAESAWQVAALPGAPVETRLDVVLGALAPLYRYRVSIQSGIVGPALGRLADGVARVLAPWGLVSAGHRAERFELVTYPGREFVIKEVRGDRQAFTEASRRRKRATVAGVTYGGFKLEALRRAVTALRERGIAVYLLHVPVSAWLSAELDAAGVGSRFREETRALASATGARLLSDWPAELSAESRFWDDEHMVADAAETFTAAVATALRHDVRAGTR